MATIPTIEELKQQAISDIESKLGRSAPLLPVSVWDILATAMAGLAYLVLKFGQWVRRQIFVSTADWDALLELGLQYGLTPNPAQVFIGEITATGTNGTLIPSGSILVLNGNTYVTDELGEIVSGSAIIPFRATKAGAGSNLTVSSTLEFSTPIVGINRSVTVTGITQSGEDAEADENNPEPFRRRVTFRQQFPPQGGAIPDYVVWATEVPGIAEAFVFNPGGTTVNVYPLTTSTDKDARIPDAPKLAEVQAYLEDPIRKVLGADPVALAFTNVGVRTTITNLVPNTAELRATIETEIENYLLSRRPLQFPDEDPSTRVNGINTSQMNAIAVLAGATFLEIALEFADTTPFDNYTLADDEIAFSVDVIYA